MRRVLQDAFLIRWQSSIALTCMLLLAQRQLPSKRGWDLPATIAAEFRGQIGRRMTFLCPATAPQSTIKSRAPTHTPTIPGLRGCRPCRRSPARQARCGDDRHGCRREKFQGSQRNGVISQGFGPWKSSYTFSQTGEPGQVDWKTAFKYMPIRYPDPVVVVCPPDGNLEAHLGYGCLHLRFLHLRRRRSCGTHFADGRRKVAVTMHSTDWIVTQQPPETGFRP